MAEVTNVETVDAGLGVPSGVPTGVPAGEPKGDPVPPNVPPVVTDIPTEDTPEDVELPRLEVADYHSEEVADIIHTMNHLLPDVDLSRVFGTALETGDAGDIDVNHMREVYGDKADHLIRVMQGIVNAYGDTTDTAYQEVFDKVGGQEQWATVRDVFLENCTDAERNYVARLTRSKNPQEIQEGADFVISYAQRLGGVPKTPARVKTGSTGGGGMGLSKAEYLTQYQELKASDIWHRDPFGRDEAIKALDEQRLLGMRNGK